jgi:hypothetical protein
MITITTKLTDCEYCGRNQQDCILIKRRDQPDKFLERHGEVFVCNLCLSELKGRDEIRRDEFQDNRPYIFTRDLMSEYKF